MSFDLSELELCKDCLEMEGNIKDMGWTDRRAKCNKLNKKVYVSTYQKYAPCTNKGGETE
jgi:hypothetical protein